MALIFKKLNSSKIKRELKPWKRIIPEINQLELEMMSLSNQELLNKSNKLKDNVTKGFSLNKSLPVAFALVREAARRQLGERIYDSQLIGGAVLHKGSIVEMKTGEGKTLSSVTAAYLNSLTGKGVHIVTVNDYLAERDSAWMGKVFQHLGVSVGVIKANMELSLRKAAYQCEITYGTNNEFGFDYLRDNMQWDINEKVQRGHHFCIVDEIDSILIDEARTPLIISGPADDDTKVFSQINTLINHFSEVEKDSTTGEYPEETEGSLIIGDYKTDEKGKRISFTDQGMQTIQKILQQKKIITDSIFTESNFEYIHYFTQALRAHHLFRSDVDYVVENGKVEIVDEFTGRILYGRRYSDGLHQAIEAKEKIRILRRNKTLASITFQNYFKLYERLSGMTGTADTEATEFSKIYGLDVIVVPTNRPVIRNDADDIIFLTEKDKHKAICDEIVTSQKIGQPVLVGTVSIEKSELLSKSLTKRGIIHEILNAKNHAREASIIAQAGAKNAVTIATNMAGRGTDIKLGGNLEFTVQEKSKITSLTTDRIYEFEFPKWQNAYNKVTNSGGLKVIGTERHESRRIDNQLRGRSGRQGDPGSSHFYISLDDDLMRLFGENLRNMMSKIGFADGDPLTHPWINKSLERAQHRVEERNFEIRKHLLEFDDVLNEQRKFVYRKRDEIMSDQNLLERVIDATKEELNILFEETIRTHNNQVDWPIILSHLKRRFFFTMTASTEEYYEMTQTTAEKFIVSELHQLLQKKSQEIGQDNFNTFIKYEYLRAIDSRWQEHLDNLGALQEAVRLRTYSQKNPLLEYKLEGFKIFDEMLDEIRLSISEKIFKITVRHSEQKRKDLSNSQKTSQLAHHSSLLQFGPPSTNDSKSANKSIPLEKKYQVSSSNKNQPILPTREEKIGRNNLCPCGSGRKYKYCHGN